MSDIRVPAVDANLPRMSLGGAEDWTHWSDFTRTVLEEHAVWDIVTGKETAPSSDIVAIQEFREKSAKAARIIKAGLATHIYTHVLHQRDPKKIWDKLESVCDGRDTKHQQMLMRMTLGIPDNETIMNKPDADRVSYVKMYVDLLEGSFKNKEQFFESLAVVLLEKSRPKDTSKAGIEQEAVKTPTKKEERLLADEAAKTSLILEVPAPSPHSVSEAASFPVRSSESTIPEKVTSLPSSDGKLADPATEPTSVVTPTQSSVPVHCQGDLIDLSPPSPSARTSTHSTLRSVTQGLLEGLSLVPLAIPTSHLDQFPAPAESPSCAVSQVPHPPLGTTNGESSTPIGSESISTTEATSPLFNPYFDSDSDSLFTAHSHFESPSHSVREKQATSPPPDLVAAGDLDQTDTKSVPNTIAPLSPLSDSTLIPPLLPSKSHEDAILSSRSAATTTQTPVPTCFESVSSIAVVSSTPPSQPTPTCAPQECEYCGLPDYSVETCPAKPFCSYCQLPGHTIKACSNHPNDPPTITTTATAIPILPSRSSISASTSIPQTCKYCHQPGHRLEDCPIRPPRPAKYDGNCAYCHLPSHVVQDCPTRPNLNNCAYCHLHGHTRDTCPTRPENINACAYCRLTGHTIRVCPTRPDKDYCYNCSTLGHIEKACPYPRIVCWFCHEAGHRQSVCPYLKQEDGDGGESGSVGSGTGTVKGKGKGKGKQKVNDVPNSPSKPEKKLVDGKEAENSNSSGSSQSAHTHRKKRGRAKAKEIDVGNSSTLVQQSAREIIDAVLKDLRAGKEEEILSDFW